ncbi:hypothetical protein [Halocatena halophila]|uniref:hypothetical protein n=1 Tax=Halocatena halophila TaxID=2814576 RepID=UPI002ED45BD7
MSEVVLLLDSIPFIGPLIVFLVSLIIGALGIHTGAKLIIDEGTSFSHALMTALIGAIIWAIVAFFIGWIPGLGPLIVLLVWIWYINHRYPGGWFAAIAIAVIAMIVVWIILYLLQMIGIDGLTAVGVP